MNRNLPTAGYAPTAVTQSRGIALDCIKYWRKEKAKGGSKWTWIALVVNFLFVEAASGQIYSYTNDITGTPNSVAANATGTNLTLGSGLTDGDCNSAGQGFDADGWPTITASTANIAISNTNGDYIQFSVTPDAGYQLNITSFTADLRRSTSGGTSSGPATARYAYSLDGGSTFTDNGSTLVPQSSSTCTSTGTTYNWNMADFTAAGTVIFRIYGFSSGSDGTGDLSLRNVTLSGTVTAMTSPFTFSENGIFTLPPGVTCIQVEAWGAGGGGSSQTSNSNGSGGGGGGAYTRGVITLTGPTINVTVGTGGSVGNAGGSSSVGSIVANGGGSSNSTSGGAGGTASAITGNVMASYAGGNGGAGNTSSGTDGGGGGGGSAFNNGPGNDGDIGSTNNTTGAAGGSGTGSGGSGGVRAGIPAAQPGNAPGGGGGGRGEDNGSSAAGANGQVTISWGNINSSDAPVVNAPICNGATSVSGTSTEANGTTITVLKNGTSIGTTTVSGGNWTLSSISPALATGDVITATAQAIDECVSASSSGVTVLANPTATITGTATICAGQSTNLSIAVTGTGPWSGTLSSGQNFSGGSSPITVSVSPNTSTTYTVATLSDANCSASSGDLSGSAVVTVDPLPMTTGVTICEGAASQALTASATCPGGSTVVQFDANGTFEIPAGVTDITVEVWGAGGGAGGGGTNARGGGGGGAYASSVLSVPADVTVGQMIAVTVGQGGAAGSGGGGTDGTAGQPSSFGSLVIAAGGSPGTSGGAGGNGGTAGSSTGDITTSGGAGGNRANGAGGGSGGQVGCATANGTNGTNAVSGTGGIGGGQSGNIGTCGTAGAGGNGGNTGASGNSGDLPGGGGGSKGNAGGASGDGANGRIVITYTVPNDIEWYAASSGGSPLHTGSSFDPVADGPLSNTNTPGTYMYWAACPGSDCRTVANFVIVANPTPSPTPSSSMLCVGGSVNIDGMPSSGTGTYTTHTWVVQNAGGTGATTGSNLTNASTQTVTFNSTGLTPGTVTLRYTVIDNAGCSGTADVTVTVVADPIAPVIDKVPNTASVCSGATLTVTVSTAGSGGTGSCTDEYRYSTDNGGSWSTWSPTLPGFAAVTGTNLVESRRNCDGEGCNSNVNQVSWTVNALPSAGTCNLVDDLCQTNTGSINIEVGGGTGPYTISWTPAHGLPASPITGFAGGAQTITGLHGGVNYIFTVTDANGCQAP